MRKKSLLPIPIYIGTGSPPKEEATKAQPSLFNDTYKK
jgi:hypothetical protein